MKAKKYRRCSPKTFPSLALAASALIAAGAPHAFALDCMAEFNKNAAFLTNGKCFYKYSETGSSLRSDAQCRKLEHHIVDDVCYSAVDPDTLRNTNLASATASCDQAGPSKDFNGILVTAKLATEVGYVANGNRDSAGNEAKVGMTGVRAEIRAEKKASEKTTVYADLQFATPTLNYAKASNQNYSNSSLYRADGLYDDKAFKPTIGVQYDGKYNQLGLKAGIMDVAGLAPLDGKPSGYYATAPVASYVSYDKALQASYKLVDKNKPLLETRFSVIDGDSVRGSPDTVGIDSRANSYPGLTADAKVHLLNVASEVPGLKRAGDYVDLYGGLSVKKDDTGSYPGEKRTENDRTRFEGMALNLPRGAQAEVRAFQVDYERNPAGDGSGHHVPLVVSQGHGIEAAIRNIPMGNQKLDLYANKSILQNKSGQPDNEWFWGQMEWVKDKVVGARVKDLGSVKGLSLGVEYGRISMNREGAESTGSGVWNLDSGKAAGKQLGLYLQYNLGVSHDFASN